MKIDNENMPRCILMIEGNRNAYEPDQISSTMSVGELREYLEQYNDDTPVMLRNDRGYTYGSISEYDFHETYDRDEYKVYD